MAGDMMEVESGGDYDVFWGEIAPCEHVVQIYDDSVAFIETLAGFVNAGFKAGEGVIIIATATHRVALDAKLRERGVDVRAVRADGRYITVDAAEVLSRFMVNGWPDEDLFFATVMDLIARARADGRSVRAFGEMVAIMWARGDQAATVRLEHLWHRLCHSERFSLFCAYPRTGFTRDAELSIAEICATHSRVVAA
jgi:hypothetical protein